MTCVFIIMHDIVVLRRCCSHTVLYFFSIPSMTGGYIILQVDLKLYPCVIEYRYQLLYLTLLVYRTDRYCGFVCLMYFTESNVFIEAHFQLLQKLQFLCLLEYSVNQCIDGICRIKQCICQYKILIYSMQLYEIINFLYAFILYY